MVTPQDELQQVRFVSARPAGFVPERHIRFVRGRPIVVLSSDVWFPPIKKEHAFWHWLNDIGLQTMHLHDILFLSSEEDSRLFGTP